MALDARRLPRYADFLIGASTRPTGGAAPVPELLRTCLELIGEEPSIIAVDMPMAMATITCRRASDNAISAAFGAMKCSTHSPSAERPGPVSSSLVGTLAEAGYRLATATPVSGRAWSRSIPIRRSYGFAAPRSGFHTRPARPGPTGRDWIERGAAKP